MDESAREVDISKSLAPLREVVASLARARQGGAPSPSDRRRLVRRVRAAGVAAVPALVRALAGEKEEARWAGYLLERLGGARVVERVARLLEDPRAGDPARKRAMKLLANLHAPGAAESYAEPVADRMIGQSVRDLLESLEDDRDLADAVGLIVRRVPAKELPAFASEVARHGGAQAQPLLEALAKAGQLSPRTVEKLTAEAGQSLLRARHADPERTRGLDLLESGRAAEARPLLERVIARDPDDGEALSFFGVCCLELGDAEDALPYLERATAVEPEESLHQWNLAAAAKCADQTARCYRALERYLALPDAAPGARQRRSEARGFVRSYAREVRRAHPGVEVADYIAGEEIFREAYCALEEQRYGEAEAGFRRVLALVPRHWPSWGNLGAVHFAEGRRADAEECLRRALELKPGYEVALENLRRLNLS